MSSSRVILCMRWGALYPSAYVNVLYSAVQKHLSAPFRFVCLTNEADGLAQGIETYPIPDLGYSERHWRHGAWPKLSVFVPDLYGLQGRALFIDLDSVIVGGLDPFFDVTGDLISIGGGPRWRRGSVNADPILATGVFAFEIGSQPQIVERFRVAPEAAFDRFGIEQRFVQEHVTSWTTWPADWVISFKRHLQQPILMDRILSPREPDPNARIVAFHGEPRPIDVARETGRPWAKFPRWGRGPVPWVRHYWLENGYSE